MVDNLLEEKKRLLEEIDNLKAERNRLLRKLEGAETLLSKALYVLPSFEFKEPRPDWCIICDHPSDVIIRNEKNEMHYGLCERHFRRMLEAEK